MKSRVLVGQCILCPRATGRHHLVESRHPVAFLELGHILAHFVDKAGDIVALVQCRIHKLWQFPVLGVRTAHDDFDDDLVSARLRNRRVDDADIGS